MRKMLPTEPAGPTSMHQLGSYIVLFQTLEWLLNEMLIQTIDLNDREIVQILVHELDFGKRVNTADVLFSYIINSRFPAHAPEAKLFHKLAEDIVELSKRRNDFVHSRYAHWMDIEGREGLIRSNSKFKTSRGERQSTDEDLLPQAFEKDHEAVRAALGRLERFRLLLIDLNNPISD